MYFSKKRITAILILLVLFSSSTFTNAFVLDVSTMQLQNKIEYDELINQCIHIKNQNNRDRQNFDLCNINTSTFEELKKGYPSHPSIEFVSIVEETITIKFIDGSYTVLLNTLPTNTDIEKKIDFSANIPTFSFKHTDKKALLLNPSEYLYGNRHCRKILSILLNIGYNMVYLVNEDVDLTFIRDHLCAEIVYMNTHAGYWDLDGDQQGDVVVIATGEHWTNNTEQIYKFEIENQMIVKGMVANQSFIAFTPAFIEYYYSEKEMPKSLVYMATCHAAYDDTMANAFLESGSNAYIGWTKNTISWINSYTSVLAFKLLAKGLPVKWICRLIRYGGITNLLLGSKLKYYGNGYHRISSLLIPKTLIS